MTNETREEIVRQTKAMAADDAKRVFDAATEMGARPLADTGQADTDPIGRIAIWLSEAREAGYTDLDIAQMMAQGTIKAVVGGPLLEDGDSWSGRLADALDAMASSETGIGPIGQEVDNG